MLDTPERAEQSHQEHLQILAALEQGGVEAVAAATEIHIANGFAGIARRLSETIGTSSTRMNSMPTETGVSLARPDRRVHAARAVWWTEHVCGYSTVRGGTGRQGQDAPCAIDHRLVEHLAVQDADIAVANGAEDPLCVGNLLRAGGEPSDNASRSASNHAVCGALTRTIVNGFVASHSAVAVRALCLRSGPAACKSMMMASAPLSRAFSNRSGR